jgi:hypothetical protein
MDRMDKAIADMKQERAGRLVEKAFESPPFDESADARLVIRMMRYDGTLGVTSDELTDANVCDYLPDIPAARLMYRCYREGMKKTVLEAYKEVLEHVCAAMDKRIQS